MWQRWLLTLGVGLVMVHVTSPAVAQVVINEILADNSQTNFDEDGDDEDWVELVNLGSETVDLANWSVTDDLVDLRKWVFPEVRLGPGEHLLVWMSRKDRYVPPSEALSGDEGLLLFEPVFVDDDALWRYLIAQPGTPGPPAGWSQRAFDASSFSTGTAGFGYADGDDSTILPEQTNAVFVRTMFDAPSSASLSNLVLEIDFDDGFVAYLNGVRVASSVAPSEDPNFDSVAPGKHEAGTPERYDLSPFLNFVVPTGNVLAVVGLNNLPSSDMTLRPRLGIVPNVLHTNFRLERDGEEIHLVDDAGVVADSIAYPFQTEDHSYGRFPDGIGEWRYLLTPTPSAPNLTQAFDTPIAAEIEFSVENGRHPAPVELTIESFPAGFMDVRYTTDGREPDASSERFTDPIVVEENTVFRAAGFVGEERGTHVVSKTYLIGGAISLPVLSISMDPDDYADVHNNTNARGRASERPAYMEYIEPDGMPGVAQGMGLRLHGGAGRGGDFATKKAYKAYFRGIYGAKKLRYPIVPSTDVRVFDKLVLRSGFNDSFRTNARATYLRDELVRLLHEQMGGLASHGGWCVVYVNMQFRGLYNIVERMDEEFLGSYFQSLDWDVIKTGNDALVGTRDEWDRLHRFFVDNDLSDDAAYEQALRLIDVENFTSYMIVNMWAQNHDWPHNNWYAARERQPDARWIFLCWDAEFGVGLIPQGYDHDTLEFVVGRGGVIRDVFVNLLDSPSYQAYFIEELDRHLAATLEPDTVVARIRTLRDHVIADVPEETAPFGRSVNDWRNNVAAMETFARVRGPIFRQFVVESARFAEGRMLAPEVSACEPPELVNTGGVVVTLTGRRFSQTIEVYFDELEGQVLRSYALGTRLDVEVPFALELNEEVRVRVVERMSDLFDDLDQPLRVELPFPEVQSLVPGRGSVSGGERVRLTGQYFLDGVRIFFGEVEALAVEPIGTEGREIDVVTPPGSGSVELRVFNTRPGELEASARPLFVYEEAPSFLRGDVDGSGALELTDAIVTLNALFLSHERLPCEAAADTDGSGGLDLTDAIVTLNFLFVGGRSPVAPFPDCGRAVADEALSCSEPHCE